MATGPDRETANQPVHVLAVMADDEDYQLLRDLLVRADSMRMRIDHARSAEEARTRLQSAACDLLLWDLGSGESPTLADEFTSNNCPGAPLILLQNYLTPTNIQAVIQSQACNHACQCDLIGPCLALAMLRAIETYCAHKRMRSALTASEKLRRAVEQSHELVMISDQAGAIEYVNPSFENLTGYTREEVIGQTFGILKSDQQPGELYEEMWDTVLSGNVFRGILTDRKKNGDTFIVEKVMTPLVDDQHHVTHFISTARDITDRRKLEADLQQIHKMDALGQLAGGVAHDFNNLLMVISAYAELTLDALAPGHPLGQNVKEILTASRRAADLTRQLLAFGRKQMQSLQVLDLNKVIGDISRTLPRLIGEDIQLAFIPGEKLGKVKADPVQIEQVVMNLASNARDAMPRGGKLTIETANMRMDDAYVQRRTVVPKGNYVLIAVTDSGEGIASEHLAHIFEPFYTTKDAGKGTGLGLATVYGIVKQSGGFIWVYSEPGLGTTFKIYLPQVQAEFADGRGAASSAKSPYGCETLLLVEDETAVRESEREFLLRHGYKVLEAKNGEEAVRLSRSHNGPIHLMITDVVMPTMGGAEVAELLSGERPDMRVLYVSGYAENTVLSHGKIDVQHYFLSKPFALRALGRKVREVIDMKLPLASATTASG
jgi:two-component system, cell cycle sensor histidine kinase and response regulator CckA